MLMKHTFFDTPVLRALLRWISLFCLKVAGWQRGGQLPTDNKFVLIAAPHTTNWDLPLTLMMAFAFKVKIYWLGKESLFKFPFRTIMRWMGGIPVDRSRSNNMVEAAVELFGKCENLVLVVPPEGTRKCVRYWKTGFYSIANGAGVPIATGYLDYRTKTAGFGPLIVPTGNIESDMVLIRKFYSTITGKYPDQHDNADIDDRKR